MFFKNLLLFNSAENDRKGPAFRNKIFAAAFFCAALFCFPNMVFGQNPGYLATTNPNSFTLSQGARTSAGVYRPDSTLVRTLWSTAYYNPGTYPLQWDGKDDLGNPMPAGNYIIKVMANNVTYAWAGIVGNTSDNQSGSSVFHGYYYCMTGMTVSNGTAYFSNGYSEGTPGIAKFLTAQPQQKIEFLQYNSSTANTDIVANDGKMVYWAGYDPVASGNTFVFATNVSDDSFVQFPNGILFKPTHLPQYNAISYLNQANSLITGLAVQKAGQFLFVARAGLNQLAVVDKRTGKLMQTINVTNPKSLCVDMNDNLWMTSANTQVMKYTVNANGTLSAPQVTIAGILQPIALAVSPDNTTLAIADGGITSQQVKAFDNTTGKPTWTLGAPGGYVQDATVTNNKFYFNDVRGQMYANGEAGFLEFIAFQPDGSFWVNDPGNYRVQHYSATRKFIETIMSLPASYSTWADKNDNTRVGAEYLEFKIDNTQPLSGSTGWQLVKNWGATVPATYDHLIKFTNFITLTSNGVNHTYGFLRNGNFFYLVEFQGNNSLRFTNVVKPFCNIAKDGSLLDNFLNKYPFMGFDNANNPIWSNNPQNLGTIALLPDRHPIPKGGFKSAYLTSSGKVIFYDYGIQQSINPVIVLNNGFHLAAIQIGGKSFLWETALATKPSYTGSFPDAGHFDIGNGVNNYAGSSAMVAGQNIITGYHGEFWKNNQTNKYNHYWDNGLALGQFGITFGETVGEAPPMMTGNALSPQLVDGATKDELYLWHGDENRHGGIHKWKISGLSTIAEQDIPITYPSPSLTPANLPGIDLMAGLTNNNVVTSGSFGWTRTPVTEDYTNKYTKFWTVKTGIKSYLNNSVDVYMYSMQQGPGINTVTRDLGTNKLLASWSLNGILNFEATNLNLPNGNSGSYVEILDSGGKIITRLYLLSTTVPGGSILSICANDKFLTQGPKGQVLTVINLSQPFEISAAAGTITFKYATYSVTTNNLVDPTADWRSPKTLRFYFFENNATSNYPRTIDIADARFVTNQVNQTINFNPTISNTNIINTLVATASSNLPVIFTVVSGPATIVGNIITFTGVGKVVVKASQPGNSIYSPAAPVIQTFANTTVRTDL